MTDERYVAANTPDAFERSRLDLLARLLDPITRRRLEFLGVPEGAACLEAGAGTGTIARWLSARVGPRGRVVALDRDTRFLEPEGALEVHQGDLLTADLGGERYDVAHCRALLMHLDAPQAGVERLAGALRPGGVLLTEEEDHASFAPADPRHPSAARFEELSRRMLRGLSGLVDPFLGRRLPALLEGAGLRPVGHEGTVAVHRGGETGGARSARMHLQVARAVLVQRGILAPADCDELDGILGDPSFAFVDVTLFGAWGRR
ncbi:MAG: methyltransferase domain-containing protein [Acidobacteriota bacterium]|jgi:SAM-dependent methyltransferase